QTSEGLGFALIAAHFEDSFTSDANLDLVAFLEVERVDDRRRQPHRQAIAPFRYLHWTSLIYTAIVYQNSGWCLVPNENPAQPTKKSRSGAAEAPSASRAASNVSRDWWCCAELA